MIRKYFYILFICVFAVLSAHANKDKLTTDSIEISLLTCSPGNEVWAEYGHTAVRIHNYTTGMDIAVNYGMFNMHQSYFIPKFILGITDYEMGVIPMEYFLAEYAHEGRGVTEQVLDLPNDDKNAILKAFELNAKPENTTYRYNYFYDNCTTRARDLIANALKGTITYPASTEGKSFRTMIHEYNHQHKWSQFGEDLLLGIAADKERNQAQQQFLPNNLMQDFAKAKYNGKDLVKQTNILLDVSNTLSGEKDFPSPLLCSIIFAIIALSINAVELKKKVLFSAYDATLMVVAGCVGLILFVMLFSNHPCVQVNGLLLFLNPLPLFTLYGAIKHDKTKRLFLWWKIWGGLIILSLVIGIFQYYPLPIVIMASLLLMNCYVHIHLEEK